MKHIYVRKWDWCKTELVLNGKNSDSYVVNAERKTFCKIHTPGEEPVVEDSKNKIPIIPLPNTIYKSDFYS